MTITYTIAESQLVRLFHGRPETAWYLPAGDDVTVVKHSESFWTNDDEGCVDCDMLRLSDGRIVDVQNNRAFLWYSFSHAYEHKKDIQSAQPLDLV